MGQQRLLFYRHSAHAANEYSGKLQTSAVQKNAEHPKKNGTAHCEQFDSFLHLSCGGQRLKCQSKVGTFEDVVDFSPIVHLAESRNERFSISTTNCLTKNKPTPRLRSFQVSSNEKLMH
eukprot:6197414-Pleurochrysis_carterae.AAC.2